MEEPNRPVDNLQIHLETDTVRRKHVARPARQVLDRDPFIGSTAQSAAEDRPRYSLVFVLRIQNPDELTEEAKAIKKEIEDRKKNLNTPTPHQRRHSEPIMDRRPSNLPTGHGGYNKHHVSFPQYLSVDQQQSTDSNGSTESFMTQVPLSYYLPQDYMQKTTFYNQTEPWGTPNLSQESIMPSLPTLPTHLDAPKLNPNSDAYVPSSGYPPTTSGSNFKMATANHSFDSQSAYEQSQAWSRDSSFSSASTYPQIQMGAEMGTMAYQSGRQYVASFPSPQFPDGQFDQYGVPSTGPQFSDGQFNHHGMTTTGPPTPYPHFPPHIPTSTDYNPYSNIPGQMGHYSQSSSISPAMTYATITSPLQGSRSMAYNDGTGHGVSQAWGSLYGNGPPATYGVQSNVMGGINGLGRGYGGSGTSYSQQRGSYGGGSDNSHNQNKSKHRTSSTSNRCRSHQWNAPSNKSKGKGKLNESSRRGPVFAPAKKSVRAASPDRSVGGASHASSRPKSSHQSKYSLHSSNSLASEATKVDSANEATPGPQPRALDIEFKSERKSAETPRLRSRRHQSISAITTDPARKQSVSQWLDSTPITANQLSLEEAAATVKRHQSPPKMPAFYDARGGQNIGVGTLKPINENDPFVTHRPTIIEAMTPYRGGRMAQCGLSRQLALLTHAGTIRPSIEAALDSNTLPFIEYCRLAKADNYGVIKIKNIPYNVNRPEVLAFLGRNARIVAESDHEPVHIIMERVTSKTLDCYVEFVNFNEAVAAVQRFETNRAGGRGGRLGQRHVEVELSSQEQLMHDLFPKAKNVTWKGARPVIHPTDPNDIYNSGFQGFISREELVMLVKHVEAPQRSPFSKECPQRPFECLISTLLKFPWHMVDYITNGDRHQLYKSTFELLTMLMDRVNNSNEDVNLTPMLLKRVWKAALKCPGFTPTQKDSIAYIAGVDAQTTVEMGFAPFASYWYDIFTIGAKPDAPQDLILWYVAIIREYTEAQRPKLSLAEQAESGETVNGQKLFGDLDKYIGHDKSILHLQTLGQIAKAEWAAIERVLRLALTPALKG